MASNLYYNGQTYLTPITVSSIVDGAMAPQTSPVGNVLAIVGIAAGGQPNTVMTFQSPEDAAATLVSGDLLKAVQKSFAPSTDEAVNAPSEVSCINVGESTQSSVTVLDGTGAQSMTLTSAQYGLPANSLQLAVAAGTTVGTKLTLQNGSFYLTQDNIARTAFTLLYTGTQVSAQARCTGTQVTLYAPAGTVVANFALANYATVDLLVQAINATTGFVASIGPYASGTPASNGLDGSQIHDCKTAALPFTANLQACVDWVNDNWSGTATAARAAGALQPPAAIGFTNFSGAVAPVPVYTDWTNALNTLQAYDCQAVSALSSDPAIHAMLSAHVTYMSNVARHERRGFVGPALGTTVAQVEALPMAINNDRMSMCYPGYQDYDQNGNLVTYASYFTGALAAACFCGMEPGEPLTNKTVSVVGLETPSGMGLRNPADTDPLIASGVMAFISTKKGYKCVRSISTWLQNNNYNRVEVSTGYAVDYTIRTIREACDVLRGGRNDPVLLSRYVETAKTALDECAIPPPVGPGTIVGDADDPPYANITATLQGDQVAIQFSANVVVPNNFTTITMYVQAYQGTASV